MRPFHIPALSPLDFHGECRRAASRASAPSGEFFDFIEPERGSLTVTVGEISGGGTGAALVMSGVRASLRGFAENAASKLPAAIEALNRTVCGLEADDLYIHLFCAHFHAARRELKYVSAGHDPVLLLRRGFTRVRRLDSTGALMGLTRRSEYRQRTLALEAGDLLIAFSSGIHEIDALEIASKDPDAPAAVLAQRIVHAGRSRGGTVAVVRFNEEGSQSLFEDSTAATICAAA
jgi:serine phosphatase RsbU (regulator of sigma subunit)